MTQSPAEATDAPPADDPCSGVMDMAARYRAAEAVLDASVMRLIALWRKLLVA